MKKTLILAAICIAAVACNRDATPLYKDASAPIDKRVEDLLDRMTLDEMITEVNLLPHWAHIDSSVRAELAANRVGAILKASGVELTRSLQEDALASSRLGIPMMFHEDVIHGYRTIFPIPLAEACCWDPAQVEKNSAAIAREAAAAGLHLTYAPMVDVSTDGRWGRILETSGEDPFLSAELAAARVRGFQGEDLADPFTIMSCVKHFAGYACLGAGRDYLNDEFSLRDLEEIYLPPYRAAIAAGVGALMESYTMYDGVPVSFNKFMLTDLLRGELGYRNLLMTDWKTMWYAIYEGASASEEESVERAFKAGIDMDMTSGYSVKHLHKLVDEGKVSKARVREAAAQCLKAKFKMGLFDDPFRYCDPEREAREVMSPAIRAVAREAASGSMVLLKNNGVLPLKKGSAVKVCGPLADDGEQYLGAWACCGKAEEIVTVKQALPSVFKVSESAPVAVVCIGEPRALSGEGVSTGKLEIEAKQIELLKSLKRSGRKVVAVLFNGRPLCVGDILDNCDALLEAWYPGTEGGNAVADILCGDINPSGRLCQTFPKHVGQVPISYYPFRTFGYVYHADLGKDPQFPFGFGLSYTTFEIGEPVAAAAEFPADGTVDVTVEVKNTGSRAGTQTVQLYIADLVASVIPRERMLKAFRKVSLEPGETKSVTFTLGPDEFKIYDKDHRWTVEPGEFRIEVGSDAATTKSVTVKAI